MHSSRIREVVLQRCHSDVFVANCLNICGNIRGKVEMGWLFDILKDFTG